MIFDFFKTNKSASTATERLKFILAHERSANLPYMEAMKNEILAVIKKYTKASQVDIKSDSNQNIKMIEIEITLNENTP